MKGTMQIERLTAVWTEPMTQGQLCRLTGLRQAVISRYLGALMTAGKAHVCAWQPAKASNGPPQAVYSPTPGANAECTIRKLSVAERVRRCRDKKRKLEARAEMERRTLFMPPKVDILTACFFGMRA